MKPTIEQVWRMPRSPLAPDTVTTVIRERRATLTCSFTPARYGQPACLGSSARWQGGFETCALVGGGA